LHDILGDLIETTFMILNSWLYWS